jgi:hypothetical protein
MIPHLHHHRGAAQHAISSTQSARNQQLPMSVLHEDAAEIESVIREGSCPGGGREVRATRCFPNPVHSLFHVVLNVSVQAVARVGIVEWPLERAAMCKAIPALRRRLQLSTPQPWTNSGSSRADQCSPRQAEGDARPRPTPHDYPRVPRTARRGVFWTSKNTHKTQGYTVHADCGQIQGLARALTELVCHRNQIGADTL